MAAAAAVLASILLLGGCAALVVWGIDQAEDEIDESAITRQQFDAIPPGATEAEVRLRLGAPLSEDSYSGPRLDCIYYAQKGEGLLGVDDFEFCFRNGVLVSKSLN